MKRLVILLILGITSYIFLSAQSKFFEEKPEDIIFIEEKINGVKIVGAKTKKSASIMVMKEDFSGGFKQIEVSSEVLGITTSIINQMRTEGYSLKSTEKDLLLPMLGKSISIVLFFEK